MIRSKFFTIVIALCISLITIALIYFPKESLEASKVGLDMWWKIVFPSLLPFLILAELLIGFGVVRFIGVLFEPLMRPLFRVPGVGGFVWAMGMASGFPAGAKLTARLRQENQLTAIEAERLASFTNASNPLFIFAAISVGFFNNARLGIILAVSHYVGNMIVGLIMRFHGENQKVKETNMKKKHYFKEAFRAMHETRLKEKRPFGKILGDAVTSSIQTLLMIGGFIILFSVFNKILSLVNITSIVGNFISIILTIFRIPKELSVPLISGLFEITSGSLMTSQAQNVKLIYKVIITSFVLGFCGFSVQAQVASILAETDIRFKPFFIARLMHGMIAAFLTFLLWRPLYEKLPETESTGTIKDVFLSQQPPEWIEIIWNYLILYGPLFTIGSLLIYIFVYTAKQNSPQH